MSSEAYLGTAKRTFAQAVHHLLETEYGLLGSGRVLQLLAGDLQQLADQFYPRPEYLTNGWMIFTGTKATGNKVHPGQMAGDHELVTLPWPVLIPEDVDELANLPDASRLGAPRQAWLQKRLTRIVEYGWNHPTGPVLLTLADLSAMLGLSVVEVSKLLEAARRTTGKPLLTKGYFFDQGMRPTHKAEVVALYEQGLDEAEIVRRTGHSAGSVGHYIRDYERVKLALKRHIAAKDIGRVLGLLPNVVKAYREMVYRYHPELEPGEASPPQS